jgi:hypothetical protein
MCDAARSPESHHGDQGESLVPPYTGVQYTPKCLSRSHSRCTQLDMPDPEPLPPAAAATAGSNIKVAVRCRPFNAREQQLAGAFGLTLALFVGYVGCIVWFQ